jgi:hypothetical protein
MWSESTAVANTVQLVTGTTKQLGTTTAGGANELLVRTSAIGFTHDPAALAKIVVTDPDGGSAASKPFDRYLPANTSVWLTIDDLGQVHYTVYPGPLADKSPNDPLDIENGNRYDVHVVEQTGSNACAFTRWSYSTSYRGQVGPRSKPYLIRSIIDNEWGMDTASAGAFGTAGQSGLTISAPTVTQYGAATTISGTLTETYVQYTPQTAKCQNVPVANSSAKYVIVQARNSSTSNWYTVGGVMTTTGGKYSLSVNNPGGREYRTIRTNILQNDTQVIRGASTAGKFVRTTTKLNSAKFIYPVINYGTQPQAYLWVDPPGAQKAVLQFKNASGAWQGVITKTLSAGRGIATFPWNVRGTFQFRWYIPATISSALPVEAVYTGPFTLTVR